MKKIIKNMNKDFPPIVFDCDFCGAEFAVSPPEKDMKIDIRLPYPIYRNEDNPFVATGYYKITTYISHCPVCGERVCQKIWEERGLDE